MTAWHHVPVHTLARVQYNKDSILIYWYGDEWLNELLEQNRIRIKHETVESAAYDRQLLTASTDELAEIYQESTPMILKPRKRLRQFLPREVRDAQEELGIFLKLKPYDGPLPE